jgi:hypothetical protein
VSSPRNDPEAQAWNRELLQRLQELGWAKGRVEIEFRFAGGDEARLSSLATELIELRPDMIIAVATAAAAALRQQTLSIPPTGSSNNDVLYCSAECLLLTQSGHSVPIIVATQNDGRTPFRRS